MAMQRWLGIETRHLAALVAVHREGSFRGAAAALGYAQSAVSERVAQTEQLIGTRVVERAPGRRYVGLTEAGERLVVHAEGILAALDAALVDLRAFTSGRAATLQIGAYESVSTRLLPGALSDLARSAPGVEVVLREDPLGESFFPLVARGELDAAFADLPLRPGPFAFRELVRDPCMLLVSTSSPLAARAGPPTLDEIAAMLDLLTEHLRTAGVEPQFVIRSELNGGVQSLVAEGVGAALMPRLAVDEGDPRVVAIPLDGMLPARRICLYWHKERKHDHAIRQFLAALLGRSPSLAPSPPRGRAAD
jgi:molybdate transport repressor ModE-like protein